MYHAQIALLTERASMRGRLAINIGLLSEPKKINASREWII